ncbi:MAG: M48 family metalloprotease [Betaproteobacteria bacterium]|nr:M48 family metalloprotease [Betaproteobacteria bacterium]
MAQFSNPELPEEINNSDDKPLRSFFALAGSALLIGVVAAAALAFFAGTVARYLPYRTEVGLIERYAERFPPRDHPVEAYLQGIADRLVKGKDGAGGMALPEGMTIRVHYVNEPVINAFATLGGHVAVFRGLLERVPDENVLAMVIAHEIAHAQHRHPIASLGRGVAFGAMLSIVSAAAGSSVVESTLGRSGMLTLLSFSRAQEEEADETGVAALVRAYEHAGGATETFKVLQRAAAERGHSEAPEFLSTHPVTQERIARLAATIDKNGWKTEGTRTPIPETVRVVMEKDAKEKPDSANKGGTKPQGRRMKDEG